MNDFFRFEILVKTSKTSLSHLSTSSMEFSLSASGSFTSMTENSKVWTNSPLYSQHSLQMSNFHELRNPTYNLPVSFPIIHHGEDPQHLHFQHITPEWQNINTFNTSPLEYKTLMLVKHELYPFQLKDTRFRSFKPVGYSVTNLTNVNRVIITLSSGNAELMSEDFVNTRACNSRGEKGMNLPCSLWQRPCDQDSPMSLRD